MKIGIFDSGIGGEAIAKALTGSFPDANIQTVNDSGHLPYGNKTKNEVISLTDSAIQPLLKDACDIIVIACNTATAFAIEYLRSRYPDQKFIGIEPMIKTAATRTTNKKIAVFATAGTLSSARYNNLKKRFASNSEIMEPDCSNWAELIENNNINREHIQSAVEDVCSKGADVIVLGCTHYHWIKDTITELAADRATVIEPSEAISRRVKELLDLR